MSARKFFAFFRTGSFEAIKVAALSAANASNFEDACKRKHITCEPITEDVARRLLEAQSGYGAGCYTQRSRIMLSEAQKRDWAMTAQADIAKMVGLYYTEKPILLEPMRELIEA